MPRPKNPNAPTASERARASRERRNIRLVELPAAIIARIDAIAAREGDGSRAAVLARAVERLDSA